MSTEGKKLSFTGYALFCPSSNLETFIFSQIIRIEHQKQDIADSQASLQFLQNEKKPELQYLFEWNKNDKETLQEELAEIQKQLRIAEQAQCLPHEKEEQARIVERIRGHEQNHKAKLMHRNSRLNQYDTELKQVNSQINELEQSIPLKQEIQSSLESALEKAQQKLALKQEILAKLKLKQQNASINAEAALAAAESERRTFGRS